eukprot:228354-Pelagomonas_calceolata.AAC.3
MAATAAAVVAREGGDRKGRASAAAGMGHLFLLVLVSQTHVTAVDTEEWGVVAARLIHLWEVTKGEDEVKGRLEVRALSGGQCARAFVAGEALHLFKTAYSLKENMLFNRERLKSWTAWRLEP